MTSKEWIELAESYEKDAAELEKNIERKEAFLNDKSNPLGARVKAGQALASLRMMRIDLLCTARAMRENAERS